MTTVQPGQVRVNVVSRIVDHPDVKVWSIDLHTKYAEIVAWGSSEVMLGAGEYTLRADETTDMPTVIDFELADEDWHLVADVGRYTCTVAAYKWPNDGEQVHNEWIDTAH